MTVENVDMLSSHGVMQQAPEEEDACPPAYRITGSTLLATSVSAM
jgi:hypothetical protein